MSVRASLALVFGALLLGPAVAAERTGATPPQTRMTNDFPVATDVRLGGDDTQTRLVIDLSQKIESAPSRSPTLTGWSSTCHRSRSSSRRETGEVGRGLIKAFRYGLVMQGGSRMVIDLTRPARIDKAFVLDPVDDQPARLVLDLAAGDRETFMRTSRSTTGPGQGRPQNRERDRDGRPAARSAPARGARSRTRRHRQRHQGRRAASWRRPSSSNSRLMLRDKTREDRQIPRCHDPHRRHLRGARRPRRACALAPSLAVHLDPRRRAGARRGRRPGSDRLHAFGTRIGRRGRAACRGREPGRRRSPASILRPSRTMSPAS